MNGVNSTTNVVGLVTTDFDGLLRFTGQSNQTDQNGNPVNDGESVGATRAAHIYTSTTIEVEYTSGAMQRLPGVLTSMTGLWKFDETSGTTANNSGSAGSGLNGTLQNGASFVSGHIGNGVSILASNQEVVLPDSTSLTRRNAPYSISAWVKFDSSVTNITSNTYTVFRRPGAGGTDMTLAVGGGGLYFGIYDPSTGWHGPSMSGTSLLDHNWHLVVATRNASGVAT